MTRAANDHQVQGLLQTHGPAASVLDSAAEYLRMRGLRLLPLYVVAMLPFSVAVLFLIDAIGVQHRSAVAALCAFLIPATLWRWAWLAKVQQIVQRDLMARAGLPLLRRLLWIVILRLYANFLFSWGSFLILPSFYGFFAGSFTAPLLLERDGPAPREFSRMLGWIHFSARRLARVFFTLFITAMLMLFVAFIFQAIVIRTILPALLGVDSSGAALTMRGLTWVLSWWYFTFLLMDFAWSVASVFSYYDAQARRTGSDLRARMQTLSKTVEVTREGAGVS